VNLCVPVFQRPAAKSKPKPSYAKSSKRRKGDSDDDEDEDADEDEDEDADEDDSDDEPLSKKKSKSSPHKKAKVGGTKPDDCDMARQRCTRRAAERQAVSASEKESNNSSQAPNQWHWCLHACTPIVL
jgi:hypothetical protein